MQESRNVFAMVKYLLTNKSEKSPVSLLRGILIVLNYFVGYLYLYPRLAVILTLLLNPQSKVISEWVQFAIYLWMILISIALSFPEIKRSFSQLPSFGKWMRGIAILFLNLYIFSFIFSTLASFLSGVGDSVNQGIVMQSLNSQTILTIFVTIIYAPVVEEVVFRGVIFRGLRHKLNFVSASLISGLSFGSIHIIDSLLSGNFNDGWFLLVYAGLGIFFCYAYEKDDSIFTSWMLHLVNNSISILFLLFL